MTAFTVLNLAGYFALRVGTVGPCDHFEGVKGLEVAKYKGTWYELQRDKSITFETGKCVTAEYGDDGDYVSVTNTQYFPDEDKKDTIVGYASANTWYPGWLNVYFFFGIPADYRVIAADTDSYALVYSCTSAGPWRASEVAWVLSRNKLEENSADWKALMAIVDPLWKKLMPDYDRANRMQVTKQGTGCKYRNGS